jgi:hypothetical protein
VEGLQLRAVDEADRAAESGHEEPEAPEEPEEKERTAVVDEDEYLGPSILARLASESLEDEEGGAA